MRSRSAFLLVLLWLPAACRTERRPANSDAAPAPSVVGTWRLVRYWEQPGADSSTRRYPFGRSPQGYVAYDETGHVLVHVRQRLPEPPRDVSLEEASADQLREIIASYAGSFGTYTVDERQGILTHRVEGEIPPLRGVVERATPYRLAGDTLVIGEGTTRQWVLVRVKARHADQEAR